MLNSFSLARISLNAILVHNVPKKLDLLSVKPGVHTLIGFSVCELSLANILFLVP